jgi:hypothetical protein
MWPLALIVFVASILVPMLKMAFWGISDSVAGDPVGD